MTTANASFHQNSWKLNWRLQFHRFCGAIRNVSIDPSKRIVYTKTAIVLGFAAGFLLSSRLWVSSRFYPLIPILHGLPRISFPLDYICLAGLFLLLALVEVASKPRIYIYSFACLLLFLALLDQNRWQPWVYLYLFMLLALSCFSWRPDDIQGRENALNICRLIVGTTYIYSGLQKLNPRFAIGAPLLLGATPHRLQIFHAFGWFVACIEASIGIGLLTHKYRNLAVLGGIFMHLFILYSCAIVYQWNSVVWPWNIAMIAFLLLLFWKTDFTFRDVVWRNPIRFQKVVLVLFGVLPLLSFFGWWDSYLSASLYSGNVPMADVLLSTTVKSELPKRVQKYVTTLPGARNVLKIQDWSIGELNVPPYPAARAYRAVGAEICRYSHNSPDVLLLIEEKDTLLGRGVLSPDTCFGSLVVDKW